MKVEMEGELDALKQQWLATRSFEDEQAYLAARVRLNDVPSVFLDADGMLEPWLAAVIRHATGVVYATQCAGVATEQRFIEGYLVLLGGSKYDATNETIEDDSLMNIFHQGETCMWHWRGKDLPAERLQELKLLVEQITYWRSGGEGRDSPYRLCIDQDRIGEIAEGWIPIETPDGPGVLLYKNCD
jgi:hypothetical protein